MSTTNNSQTIITAALPYSNGRLHVGHIAGAYLPADIYTRYLRSKGAEVRSVCGSDDHGVAMVLAALKEGSSPQEVAKKYNRLQRDDLGSLSIDFDIYSATSQNPHHQKVSQDFFTKLFEKGYFTKRVTPQYYDVEKKMFLPDRFVKGICGFCKTPDQNGDQCEECGRELDANSLVEPRSVLSGGKVTLRDSTHWFLDLSLLHDEVKQWLQTAEVRAHTRNYVESLLDQGLIPRSMTRDLDWGIPVPLDDPEAAGKVLYVWFDAPIGYISNTLELFERETGSTERGNTAWKSPDSKIFHFIGEDNTIFHSIIWIAMLSAEGSYKLPSGVIVNQFLNLSQSSKDGEGQKMSKSKGTAIWISELVGSGVPSDSIRYYLTAIAPEEGRGTFNPSDLYARHNNELGAAVGNLYQRVIRFSKTKFGPDVPVADFAAPDQKSVELRQMVDDCFEQVTMDLEHFRFRNALSRIVASARWLNKYLDEEAPWKTIKVEPERAKQAIYNTLCALKTMGVLLSPFMPVTSESIRSMFNLSPEEFLWNRAKEPLIAGSLLGPDIILFPRLEETSENPE